MAASYLYSVTHIVPLTTIRRERKLPVPGGVSVRIGQRVQASDVLAEAQVAPRHYFLDIARGLGVPDREAVRLIRVNRGDRVEGGEVIAGPMGLSRRTVRAPADGRIAAISGSRVLLEVEAEPFGLRAGFPGVVTATDGTQSVTIEATGALIQGAWGNGRQEFGIMRLVGDGPDDRLQTDKLDINLRGAVLIAGMCDHPAPLHQATELSVRGVILGSLTADLMAAAQRLPYPLIVTEGFGRLPINPMAYNLLTSNVGREAALDARPGGPNEADRPEVIIPLPSAREMPVPDEVIPLARGIRVRVLRAPHMGAVGVIQSVEEEAVPFPSGIIARAATVDLEGFGQATIPLANLEALQ
jgi:hypothetical protein